jgi:hypothetical protein
MKRCPACNQTYADDALTFCTNDGTVLTRDRSSSFDATIISPPPSVTDPPFSNQPGGWNPPSSYPQPPAWSGPGGYQPPMQASPAGMARSGVRQQNGPAIASLICGVLSITFGLICGGPMMAVLSIVLGVVALVQIKNAPQRYSGKGLAIGGIVIGALWLILGLLIMIIMIVAR